MPRARLYRRQAEVVPQLDQLRPLAFYADTHDLLVSAVHVFPDDYGHGIAVSFLTASGSVNVLLPPELASQLGGGLSKLSKLSRAQEGAD
jgi:hypothetical protein